MGEKFWFVCSVCKAHNYVSEKNRQRQRGKITLKKYCPRCRKHTEHAESRLRD